MGGSKAVRFRCQFCGRGTDAEACPECSRLVRRGFEARGWALELEACPWASGGRAVLSDFGPAVELRELLGDPAEHELRGCPWCQGWAARERELYRATLAARAAAAGRS